jgi:hypothetical protein
MKYLAVLAVLAVIYFVLLRASPVVQVKEAVAQTEMLPLAQGSKELKSKESTALRRPLDRTTEVLGQQKSLNGEGEF